MTDDITLAIVVHIIVATSAAMVVYGLGWGPVSAFLAGFIAAMVTGEIVKQVIGGDDTWSN